MDDKFSGCKSIHGGDCANLHDLKRRCVKYIEILNCKVDDTEKKICLKMINTEIINCRKKWPYCPLDFEKRMIRLGVI